MLDTPVTGIAPAKVAPAGYLDRIPRSQLAHTLFTIVGYGTEVRKPDSGPQKPTPMSYPLIRRVADAPGQKLTPQILQVNGNINDTRGTGGSCFGDSGGPTFRGGYQVTVTSYGYTSQLPLPRRPPAHRHPRRAELARHLRRASRRLSPARPEGRPRRRVVGALRASLSSRSRYAVWPAVVAQRLLRFSRTRTETSIGVPSKPNCSRRRRSMKRR